MKKQSKHGLNTGNTIRDYKRNPALRQYQKYGCLVMGYEPRAQRGTDLKAKDILKDFHAFLPGSELGEVEYSLNKKRRWELPSQMKRKVHEEEDSEHVEVSLNSLKQSSIYLFLLCYFLSYSLAIGVHGRDNDLVKFADYYYGAHTIPTEVRTPCIQPRHM